jgi:hypothetical protein
MNALAVISALNPVQWTVLICCRLNLALISGNGLRRQFLMV